MFFVYKHEIYEVAKNNEERKRRSMKNDIKKEIKWISSS